MTFHTNFRRNYVKCIDTYQQQYPDEKNADVLGEKEPRRLLPFRRCLYQYRDQQHNRGHAQRREKAKQRNHFRYRDRQRCCEFLFVNSNTSIRLFLRLNRERKITSVINLAYSPRSSRSCGIWLLRGESSREISTGSSATIWRLARTKPIRMRTKQTKQWLFSSTSRV